MSEYTSPVPSKCNTTFRLGPPLTHYPTAQAVDASHNCDITVPPKGLASGVNILEEACLLLWLAGED